MRGLSFVVLVALALAFGVTRAQAAVRLAPIASGLDSPAHVTHRPGDPSRLYVANLNGTVRVIENDVLQPDPFMLPPANLDTDGEGGVLSLAFEPAPSPWFYVFFTEDNPIGGSGNDIVVQRRRLQGDPPNPELSDPNPATFDEVLRVQHDSSVNHNGGQLQRDAEGNLFVSIGDAGIPSSAPDTTSLLGKLLRIRPLPPGNDGYDVPAGNPFGNAVWSAGLRNPWRFSIDRATGDLYIGDVGQSDREEIDRAPAPGRGGGVTYGWPRFEGDLDSDPSAPVPPNYAPPLLVHPRPFQAITAGYVSRDPSVPELLGCFLYTDLSETALHVANPATGAHARLGDVSFGSGVVSFGEDDAGRLHLVSLFSGTVSRIEQSGPAGVPGSRCGATPASDPPNGPGSGTGTVLPGGAVTSGTPATGTSGDRSAPVVTARLGRQRALRRRAILLRVRCNEACRVTASARVRALGRTFGVRTVRRSIAAGRQATLRLRLGPRALRAARRSRRPTARIRVTVVDPAGNAARLTKALRLRR